MFSTFSSKEKNIIESLLNGEHDISEEMKKYIATPWCNCGNNNWKACTECDPSITDIKIQGNQPHGGDLF